MPDIFDEVQEFLLDEEFSKTFDEFADKYADKFDPDADENKLM
jgi:ribosomal protein S17E